MTRCLVQSYATPYLLLSTALHYFITFSRIRNIVKWGHKWWKKQDCDMAQLRMELVDIWHFILSAAIQSKHGNIPLAKMEMMAELNLYQKSVQFDNQYYGLAQLTSSPA